jgi:hypothetical protein
MSIYPQQQAYNQPSFPHAYPPGRNIQNGARVREKGSKIQEEANTKMFEHAGAEILQTSFH